MSTAVATLSVEHDAAAEARGEPLLSVRSALVITLVTAAVVYTYATHGTWSPDYERPGAGFSSVFFVAQARSILHGHLYVTPAQIPGECFRHDGRCFGYFGVTPSLLRIPFLALLDYHSLTPVYLTAALSMGVAASLALARRTWRSAPSSVRWTRAVAAVFALCLGPASFIVQLARPAMYEEAIAWSIAFAILSVYLFVCWWDRPTWMLASLILLCLALGTNARPTTLPLALALGAGMIVRTVITRGRSIRGTLQGLLTAALPVGFCFLVFWEKFHQLIPNLLLNQEIGGPNPAPWWAQIRRLGHNYLAGPRFIATFAVAYLRPDGLAFTSTFPFVDFRFHTFAAIPFIGIPKGSMYVETFSTIPDDYTLIVLLILAGAIVGSVRLRRAHESPRLTALRLLGSPMSYALVGTAGAAAVIFTTIGITNRYIGDLVPVITVAAVLSFGALIDPFARLPAKVRFMIVTFTVVGCLWALLVNLGLEYRFWWHVA